jgi:hypothetical protein
MTKIAHSAGNRAGLCLHESDPRSAATTEIELSYPRLQRDVERHEVAGVDVREQVPVAVDGGGDAAMPKTSLNRRPAVARRR